MGDMEGLSSVVALPDRTLKLAQDTPTPSSQHRGDIYLPQRAKGHGISRQKMGWGGYKGEEDGISASEQRGDVAHRQ